MNLITYDKAYCLYPRATLEERLSLITTDRKGDKIEGVYDRYRQRGWTIHKNLKKMTSTTSDPAFRVRWRWVQDGLTWSIALPFQPKKQATPINMQTEALSSDPISITTWAIDAWNLDTQQACMRFRTFSHPQLFYSYVMEHDYVLITRQVTYLLELADVTDTRRLELLPHEDRH